MQELQSFVEYLFFINPYILALALSWALAWKGVAMWRAARRRDVVWFVALLFINTLGILEIIYIVFFSKRANNQGNE